MKHLKNILELVEIRTKVASILPLALGSLLVLKCGYSFNRLAFLLMAGSLILIDMATTGLNNLYDYKRALLKEGYHYDVHNPISAGKLTETQAKVWLIAMIFISAGLGIGLVFVSHWLILILGALSFGIGVFYSFGPLPISRTPLGELFSGLFMGGLITTIALFIHLPLNAILKIEISSPWLSLTFNYPLILTLIIYALPFVFLIANIMLANNTCDIKEDIENKRYTLPVLIGEQKATKLFKGLFYSAYLTIILGVILRLMPPIQLLILMTLIKTRPMVNAFVNHPLKSKTFVNAVKTFILFATTHVLLLALSLFL